jgi:hypothetical protein
MPSSCGLKWVVRVLHTPGHCDTSTGESVVALITLGTLSGRSSWSPEHQPLLMPSGWGWHKSLATWWSSPWQSGGVSFPYGCLEKVLLCQWQFCQIVHWHTDASGPGYRFRGLCLLRMFCIVGTTSLCYSLHVACTTTMWFCLGFCWHPDVLKILYGALLVLLSPCSGKGYYGLSWISHWLTPSNAPSLHLPPPGSFTEPSNSCRWIAAGNAPQLLMFYTIQFL